MFEMIISLNKNKKSRIRETPTLSTDAASRTDTNLKRLRDLSSKKKLQSEKLWGSPKFFFLGGGHLFFFFSPFFIPSPPPPPPLPMLIHIWGTPLFLILILSLFLSLSLSFYLFFHWLSISFFTVCLSLLSLIVYLFFQPTLKYLLKKWTDSWRVYDQQQRVM